MLFSCSLANSLKIISLRQTRCDSVRDAKSAQYNKVRPSLLELPENRLDYRDSFLIGAGAITFLNNRTLYPALRGIQTNLYKNFIERSWVLLSGDGIASLLHPEGVFDDPNGGGFRGEYYPRLTAHYQLKNELILFADVHHVMAFSINTYRGEAGNIDFKSIFNLFSPATIAQCERNGVLSVVVPGIKDEQDRWETKGHPSRVIAIKDKELELFSKLFEKPRALAAHARLPQVHSQSLMNVLEAFSKSPKRLDDLKGKYLATEMFHESNAQREGVITREDSPTYQPTSTDGWVMSGPHFYVGSPFNKTPRTSCTANGHYDQVDLLVMGEDYLPRAVYRPGDKEGCLDMFYAAIPEWPKPTKPEQVKGGVWSAGFWPVADHEVLAFEMLLGEPLKRYGIDPDSPGAKTAREFGYFNMWKGDVEGAVAFLLANDCRLSKKDLPEAFSTVQLKQVSPEKDLKLLPKPITAVHRYVNRKRAQSANERTLMPSMLVKGASHVNAAAYTVCFSDERDALCLSATASSILLDFFVKVTGRGDIIGGVVDALPMASNSWLVPLILNRYLRLICLTEHYGDLFESEFRLQGECDDFTRDGCLNPTYESSFVSVSSIWDVYTPFRTDLARRQAQLEIDVLVAMDLSVSIDQLLEVYSVQFPVMKAYEKIDLYDIQGSRLPNTARKDQGAKELRDILAAQDEEGPITVSWEIDNGNQTVTKTFYPPFTHVDRIEDYKTAYRVFSERLALDNKEIADAG